MKDTPLATFSSVSNQRPLTIALVAGETSGDILGAGLIRALKAKIPDAHFVGVAGPLMQAEGCEAWYEMEELAVMGIVEVLGRLPRLLKIRKDLTARFTALKPDVFIGIDAPDFNITLEGRLKQRGIRTIHYVSPSVWAWRQKRVFKIGRATDLVLAFLPFEKAFYDRFSVPCRFIGHTMADSMPLQTDKVAAREALGVPLNAHCLAILPGSRHAEVEMLSADFLRTVQLLRKTLPDLHVLVPLVNAKRHQQFQRIKDEIAPDLSVHLLDGNAGKAMIASDATLLASGTAALECMLAKCPMVVGYRMKPFTFWLAKRLVKTPYVSLPNLLAGKELVKELLQDECKPQALSEALLPLLQGGADVEALKQTFLHLHESIRCDADEQAAQAVLELARR
ncbi:lipid-A-disaccharide synthase [Xenorhabdus bovienii]|uniref:Lipid-A-disaccharide synthase n=1 Tax=Xenorhabdus bovienii str. Intermedium TaxID=1379677 RepID=A0A077Q6S1_XENBV|nr:lipid-A-disaccharide synthase [Xenorhabdus bovienii]MDE9542740.1 lipid-A-disaccharide synthase [Xenorhabdus bovienii]MDE9551221.1 lipid-A-disaccharide synthase [Xenorhabdus bovienii]MDE9555481.1 lipid-A-disaccharide synthase [Xenorhabdus bovienii]MDE9565289.1 lipid-A-disaccharide synthase [Xenorhabdus bovienii]CDH31792.1 tetraacyldisaccharide-1-P synthase [Xenorhabdus bovienii str. Intermedium]